LASRAPPGGRMVPRLCFPIQVWRQPILPVRMPEGARLVEVRVDGRRAEARARPPSEVDLPVPVASGPPSEGRPASPEHFFEIVYVVEEASWPVLARIG